MVLVKKAHYKNIKKSLGIFLDTTRLALMGGEEWTNRIKPSPETIQLVWTSLKNLLLSL